jgi:predicted membrane channel-forming protein YqfA (hemolysin III family)
MTPAIRMFFCLAAAGILSAVGMPRIDTILGMSLVALSVIAFAAGIVNYYLHARTRWPFRRDR